MKISIDKAILVTALDTVTKAASGKTTLPILDGVLLETTYNSLYLTRNNLDTAIKLKVDCDVIQQGEIVVNAKLFTDIIRRMPDEGIDISTTDKKMDIEAGQTRMEIGIISAKDFPKMPEVKAKVEFEIEQKVLKEMVNGVAFAVSEDENRPVLTGICINVSNGQLDIVGIDGFKAAWRKLMTDLPDLRILPKGKDFESICRLLDKGTVKISVSDNLCELATEDMRVTLGVVNGDYMNYKNIFPGEFETTAKIKTREFQQTLERSLLFRESADGGKARHAMFINISEKGLKLTLTGDDGVFDEDFPVDVDGKYLRIGFDPLKIYDCLKHIEDKDVLIKFTTNVGPCVIAPVEGDGYAYLALPVRV